MRTTKRLLCVAAIGATALSLVACATSEQQSPDGPGGAGAAALDRPAELPAGGSGAASAGATTEDEMFGPACGQLPASGAGSAKTMAEEPVGTAAEGNPLLKTLSQAVKAADLVDTLNSRDKQYTVFAPANDAFGKLPAGTLQDLLEPAAKQQLSDLLTYHVLDQRLNAESAKQMKELTPIGGGGAKLTIGGSGANMTVTDGSGATAKVLCGNVPTANATVFVIDSVLQPK